jgi:hypothetical protein
VPESGTPAAIGYAEGSGIPYGQGLVKNSYVGRTFIQPSQLIRQRGIRLKLNPLRDVIAGKRIVVVDDSIVRGNTQRAIVGMLREAGAREVHVRIASPPVKWPCFYGIDFATREELVAGHSSVEEIRESIGADSLGYVSLDGLVAATEQRTEALCRACFDGQYPVPVPEEERGKDVLESPSSGDTDPRTSPAVRPMARNAILSRDDFKPARASWRTPAQVVLRLLRLPRELRGYCDWSRDLRTRTRRPRRPRHRPRTRRQHHHRRAQRYENRRPRLAAPSQRPAPHAAGQGPCRRCCT